MPRSSSTRHGKGAGIGGPAKGTQSAAPAFTAEDAREHMRPDAHSRFFIEAKAAREEQAERDAEDARAALRFIMHRAERDADRTVAAVAILNRVEGLPIARTITADASNMPAVRVLYGKDGDGDAGG